jgi:hypothetical protein
VEAAAPRRDFAERQRVALGDDGEDLQTAVERLHRTCVGGSVERAGAATLAFFGGFHASFVADFRFRNEKLFWLRGRVKKSEKGKRSRNRVITFSANK